jgi:hypothetical protein
VAKVFGKRSLARGLHQKHRRQPQENEKTHTISDQGQQHARYSLYNLQ